MAIVKNSFLQLRGRCGGYVFRRRNGKTVAYRRSLDWQVSQTPAAKYTRKSSGITVKFAVYINSFPSLKTIWESSEVKGSNAYQKIIKNNASLTNKYGLSVYNIITPAGISLFPVTVLLTDDNSLTHSEQGKRMSIDPAGHSVQSPGMSVNISLSPSTQELINFLKKPYLLHIIFYFSYPSDKTTAPFSFSSLLSYVRKAPGTGNYNIKLALNEEIISLIKKYNKANIYIAASLQKPGHKKIFWTSTFSSGIDL